MKLIRFLFTEHAKALFLKLSSKDQIFLQEKLVLLKQPDLLRIHLRKVHHLLPATHRIRIGRFRLLVDFLENTHVCRVQKVGLRKDIYQK